MMRSRQGEASQTGITLIIMIVYHHHEKNDDDRGAYSTHDDHHHQAFKTRAYRAMKGLVPAHPPDH